MMAAVGGFDAWAGDYDAWSGGVTADIPFYVGLALETEGPLVELAVGTGRVAIPVARQTGRRVLGIDNAPRMLERARERVAEAGVDVELRLADMRELEVDEPAGLVYCPFNALLALPTWADKRQVFERVAAALRPGGRFAWDAMVLDPQTAARDHGAARPRDGGRVWEYVEHSPADNRVDVATYVGGFDREPQRISLWWATRSEWEGLLESAGLEVEELCGWFDRRPFDEGSREFVWIARKPG
jgi:SAM-dependent methyltransferase